MITPVLEQEITAASQNVINLDEAARAADALVRDGVSGLCLNGTFGELPSLTWQELQDFTEAVVTSVAGRVPVFAGATTLNRRDSIARARRFREIGADGLLLGRPMMSALGDESIVQFYTDVAHAVPDMAIFLYDDAEAFKRPLTSSVYGELSKLPSVSGGPAPVMALARTLEEGRWADADAIWDDIRWSMEGLIPEGGFESWHVYKIPTLKARFAAAGYIKTGPPLPPYQFLPPERRETAEAVWPPLVRAPAQVRAVGRRISLALAGALEAGPGQ